MKTLYSLLLSIFLASLSSSALADSWKDEDDHDRDHKHGREYKEEYWDGNCKVKRKLEKNGDYKEERKCKGPQYGYGRPAPVYVPAPVVVEPGVHVYGTVNVNR